MLKAYGKKIPEIVCTLCKRCEIAKPVQRVADSDGRGEADVAPVETTSNPVVDSPADSGVVVDATDVVSPVVEEDVAAPPGGLAVSDSPVEIPESGAGDAD